MSTIPWFKEASTEKLRQIRTSNPANTIDHRAADEEIRLREAAEAKEEVERARELDAQRHAEALPLSQEHAAKSHQLLSGEAMYRALAQALNELLSKAPSDHDVLIEAFGLTVHDVHFIEPHTFVFIGRDSDGNAACAVAHFSQVVTHVIFRPKEGQTRVVTGFAKG